MLRKKPENRYPYINPDTAQCVGASVGQGGASIRQGGENTNRQAQAPMSGAGKVSDNDEALPSNPDELRRRRLQYFGRSGNVAVSVAATADPVAAQGHPEVVNAVMQVMMTILHFNLRNYPFRNLFRPAHPPAFCIPSFLAPEPYTTIPHTPPTIHHYTT